MEYGVWSMEYGVSSIEYRRRATCEGGAFEGTRGYGDRGTRGVSEGLRTGGHEDTREAALGVFFVLGSLFLCSGLKVGRVVPNPPLTRERRGTRSRCVRPSANGRLGTAVPTQRDGVARWMRLAVGNTERQRGQHAVLPLPHELRAPGIRRRLSCRGSRCRESRR
jgi:hypothetical protein